MSDPATIATSDLGPLAGRFLVTGHTALAQALVEEAARRDTAGLTSRQRRELSHLREWTHPAVLGPAPQDAVRLGVLDYRQPDRARVSKNIGDYVQTLALLGNLARFTHAEFTGVAALGELAAELQSRVRSDLRIESPPHRVHLVPVSRDFSVGDPVPEDTWLLAFGWHMHSSFGLRFGLPYHSRLMPLFVSFHLSNLAVLDEPAVSYLRRSGPIGCRDWTTVDLLLSAGVDAFFTGCVTTTVDGVFPPLASIDRSGVDTIGVIDLPKRVGRDLDQPVDQMRNAHPSHRNLDLVSGTRAAMGVLEQYQQRLDRIITGRLHSYLPAVSLGLEVDFRPRHPNDVRLVGLDNLHPASPELERMRAGLRDLLEKTLCDIMSGAHRDDVYAAWRARTAPLVAAARARHSAPAHPYPAVSPHGISRRSSALPERAPAIDAAIDVAIVAEGATLGQLPAVVDTVVGGTTVPLRIWVITRQADAELPELPVTYLRFGEAPPAAELLLLPALLPEVTRLVVLDVEETAEATVDIVRLAGIDLHGHAVAARKAPQPSALRWRRAADRLPPGPAAELRRLMSARHPFDVRALGRSPLVLDLARMRADDSLVECLALAAAYELDRSEALLAYAGCQVTALGSDLVRRSSP